MTQPQPAAAIPPPRWQTRIAAAFPLVWALGIILREPIEQAASFATILFAGYLLARRLVRVPEAWRTFAICAVALCGWQVLSPAVALATGASTAWPPGGRFSQAFEPLGVVALATVAALGVPWRALAVTLAAGWLASTAAAVYQHFFGWPFDFPAWMKITTERVREDFSPGGPPRYGAGGLQFHRLRFAHAAIASLGPAMVLAASAPGRGARLWGAGVSFALLVGIWASFARAALVTALLLVGVGVIVFTRGLARRAGIAVALLVVLAALASPSWRDRFVKAAGNLFSGERRQAMTAGLMIFAEHPLLGVGHGNHRAHATVLAEPLEMSQHLTHDSHNLWVTLLAELGLFGAALAAAFYGSLAVALWRRFKQGALLSGGALLSLVGFHLLGLVHFLPFHSSVALTFYFVWGLGLVAPVPASSSRPTT